MSLRIRREWTTEEEEYLKEFYSSLGSKTCCEKLNRSSGSIRRAVIRLGLKFRDTPAKYTLEQFGPIVQVSRSYSDVTRRLGLSTGHGNRKTVIGYIRRYGLDISHFDAGYERTRKETNSRLGLDEVLVENSTYVSVQSLKKKLFKFGLKTKMCEECGQGEEWRGKRISLHLDHVNGNNKDNRIENLRILCPNCHAATDTYCNKNSSYSKLLSKKVKVIKDVCPECGKEKYKKSSSCIDCGHLRQRRVERPDYKSLSTDVTSIGYEAVGRKYGVSGASIKKWLKSYQGAA
jgi:ribosomal protein L37E